MRYAYAAILVLSLDAAPALLSVLGFTSGETTALRLAILSMLFSVVFALVVLLQLRTVDRAARSANTKANNLLERTKRLEHHITNG